MDKTSNIFKKVSAENGVCLCNELIVEQDTRCFF